MLLLLFIKVIFNFLRIFLFFFIVIKLVNIWYGCLLFVNLLIIGIDEYLVNFLIFFWENVLIIIFCINFERIFVVFLIGLLWFICKLWLFKNKVFLFNWYILVLKEILVLVDDFLKIIFRFLFFKWWCFILCFCLYFNWLVKFNIFKMFFLERLFIFNKFFFIKIFLLMIICFYFFKV